MDTRKWIFYSVSVATVAVFLFVFYKTRDGSSNASSAVTNNVDSLFFVNPNYLPLVHQQQQGCNNCSFVDYSSMTSPVLNTLPYDMMYESQMSNMPMEEAPTTTLDPPVLLTEPQHVPF